MTSPTSTETAAATAPDHAWFDEARFGLFVHFGLYAVPARHEWSMTRERRTIEDYSRYAEFFDPDRFDAREIARKAKAAGMRYAVLTTKHHEGFCLFETEYTDYSAPDVCGRDLVSEWVEALRAEGLRVGFYHSLLDWHHPDYTIDMQHPLRDTGDWDELNKTRDMDRYREYLYGQVRELLTNYGQIDYMFFDFTYGQEGGKFASDWKAEQLLALCRELQPDMIVNDRLGIPGDLVTPEQYQPDSPMTDADGNEVRWEACQTTNGSWGFDRDNVDFKSPDLLLRMLVDSVAKNGNLLLNVGPDGRGGLRGEDADSLQAFADWMELHEQSVHGAGPARGIDAPQGTILTQKSDRLYIHVATWPMQHLHVHGLAGKVRFARLLNDGSEIRHTTIDPDLQAVNTTVGGIGADVVTFTLPIRRPDVLLPVIEVVLDPEASGTVAFGEATANAAQGLA
jgi:alpha-L-fucosidase